MPCRQEPRIAISVVAAGILGGRAGTIGGTVLDLSQSGMLLETSDPLEAGTQLELRFDLPGGGGAVDALAQVLRSGPSTAGSRRHGLRLLALRGGSRRRLTDFIDALAPGRAQGS